MREVSDAGRAKTLRARAELIAAIRALPWIDPDQAAIMLEVHPATIRRALASGALAGTRIGKLWRLRPDSLEAWLSRASSTNGGA